MTTMVCTDGLAARGENRLMGDLDHPRNISNGMVYVSLQVECC
jgi:hypothetical protein